jgi:hypothetical protein
VSRKRLNKFASRGECSLNRDCSDDEWDERYGKIDWNDAPEIKERMKQRSAERAARRSVKAHGIVIK